MRIGICEGGYPDVVLAIGIGRRRFCKDYVCGRESMDVEQAYSLSCRRGSDLCCIASHEVASHPMPRFTKRLNCRLHPVQHPFSANFTRRALSILLQYPTALSPKVINNRHVHPTRARSRSSTIHRRFALIRRTIPPTPSKRHECEWPYPFGRCLPSTHTYAYTNLQLPPEHRRDRDGPGDPDV